MSSIFYGENLLHLHFMLKVVPFWPFQSPRTKGHEFNIFFWKPLRSFYLCGESALVFRWEFVCKLAEWLHFNTTHRIPRWQYYFERCFFDIQFVCYMPTLQCTSIITDTLSFLGLIYIVKYIIHSSTNYSPLNGVNIVKMFLKIRTNHDDICRVTTGQKIKYIL